jgi:hypothetical protein
MPYYTYNSITYIYQIIDTGNYKGDAIITGIKNGPLTGSISLPTFIQQGDDWIVVVEIGMNSFMNANKITSITIPEYVVTIGVSAFSGTTSLKRVLFESYFNLENIGDTAFSNSGLSTIIIPSSVMNIGKLAFNKTYSLKEITIQSPSLTIKGIDDTSAFYQSGVNTIYYNSELQFVPDLHSSPWTINNFYGATNNDKNITMIPLNEPSIDIKVNNDPFDESVKVVFTTSKNTTNITKSDIELKNGKLIDFSPVHIDGNKYGYFDISGNFVETYDNYSAIFSPNRSGECSINVSNKTVTSIEGMYNGNSTLYTWNHISK